MRPLRLALVALVVVIAAPAAADDMRAPSPKRIVYPGDILTDDMLTDAPLVADRFSGPVALAPEDVVGMMASRTLLPGRSIPMAALSPPRVVRAGTVVKMLYVEGGLTITATGDALQDGVVGQTVRLRNADSGVTVSGRVRGDGSVIVSGG